MQYRTCGHSGLKLPAISLGLWHNFGSIDPFDRSRDILLTAWDNGVTHFDLANNYGPVPGSAEITFGKVLREDLYAHRDEMIISTKAGYGMWDGPYGDGGSRKYLMASLDQSLKRMGLDYVDIFYSHRYDPQTPIEETMQALVDIVRQGKALYVGISNYPMPQQQMCYDYLKAHDVPCLISQYKASLLQQDTIKNNLPVARENGSGFIAFSPLAQGLLTDRYADGIPQGSRAASNRGNGAISSADVERQLDVIAKLRQEAQAEGCSLSTKALRWLFNQEGLTSVIVGCSKPSQLLDNIKCLE